MSYFDDPLHSTGALTTALSTHASAVQGVRMLILCSTYCMTKAVDLRYIGKVQCTSIENYWTNAQLGLTSLTYGKQIKDLSWNCLNLVACPD